MKILYISHEYKNRRLRYAKELQVLGHKVDVVRVRNKRRGHIDSSVIKDHDLILIFSVQYFENVIKPGFTKKAREKGIPIISYGIIQTSTPLCLWAKNFKNVDYPFVVNRPVVKMLNEIGVKAHYRPFGYHKSQYKPIKGAKIKYGVTFMGNLQGQCLEKDDKRAKAINKLVRSGVNVKVWGGRPLNRIIVPATRYEGHRIQNKVYNMSKINLDFPWINTRLPEYRDVLHMKNRFMEVPGAGGFLLTKRCPEFEELLEDGKHCGYYDGYGDLIDKVRFYLKHSKLRKKIASQGHSRVRKNFQFRHVLASIIDEVGRRGN